jgi:hypothetical protein
MIVRDWDCLESGEVKKATQFKAMMPIDCTIQLSTFPELLRIFIGQEITGLSTLGPEISGKQLELLKEIVPKLSRVAVFGTSTRPGNAQLLKEVELAAGVCLKKPHGRNWFVRQNRSLLPGG